MMDDRILELTEDNQSQRNNRFFLDGKPEAILIVEFVREKPEDIDIDAANMIDALKAAGYRLFLSDSERKRHFKSMGSKKSRSWCSLEHERRSKTGYTY